MGAFIVKFLPPQIHGLLFGCAGFQLHPDVPMQPFMPAIVLRMARAPALQINAQSHPPGRQPAQSQQPADMAKGVPLSLRMAPGQPVPFKQPFKTLPDRGCPRVGHPPQFQHVAAVFVPHRQWFATLALRVIPPTLEVHRPHLIGRLRPSPAPQPARFGRSTRRRRGSVSPPVPKPA